MHPIRRSDVIARDLEGETLILDRKHEEIHQLNSSASYVWHRCDGRLTISEIAAAMAKDFQIGREEAERDVTALISQLRALQLLEPQQP